MLYKKGAKCIYKKCPLFSALCAGQQGSTLFAVGELLVNLRSIFYPKYVVFEIDFIDQ